MKYPHDVQDELFRKLIRTAKQTEFGKEHGFKEISSLGSFRRNVPISTYEDIFPYIDRLMRGEQNVLWPSETKWFAKSSGTTNARSKFIPVTPEALEDCHLKAGKDMLSIYVNNYPDTKLFAGKSLSVGGSHQLNQFDPNESSYFGDVSAVIMQNLPIWAEIVRTPSLETALLDKWEEKIEKMARETAEENVTNLAGVPTWTLLILQRVLELKGAKDITEVWPNLEVFFHGAVSFAPYRELFKSLIPSDSMRYMESYNASEGFIGIQDTSNPDEMLLMLDYGIFYEFIPMSEYENDHPTTLGLDQVEIGKNYALVISTNAGLWRYKIGDTVRFTSLNPYRIKITGRTKHFINAFGEEVIVENAEAAITEACKQTDAIIDNYTAAPIYLEIGEKGGHEWVVEFIKPPSDFEKFKTVLDNTLRKVNSDYDAKRYQDLALDPPLVHSVGKGTFYNWMKSRDKLGGQNKVPRLSNNREYMDSLLKSIERELSGT